MIHNALWWMQRGKTIKKRRFDSYTYMKSDGTSVEHENLYYYLRGYKIHRTCVEYLIENKYIDGETLILTDKGRAFNTDGTKFVHPKIFWIKWTPIFVACINPYECLEINRLCKKKPWYQGTVQVDYPTNAKPPLNKQEWRELLPILPSTTYSLAVDLDLQDLLLRTRTARKKWLRTS